MNDLFLCVRPPRPLWPFNGPSTAFWPPLAFASLAAALRSRCPGLGVEVLDAPALEMGWRTLGDALERRHPTWVAIGEEAVSCVEGLRLARLARATGARVIAGGCFFGQVAREAIQTGLIDVVAQGEGEETVVELTQALRDVSTSALRRVAGITFRDGDEIVTTAPRPLLGDLDALPLPAYDLLPVERYGARSRNHPQFAAIELGRGCVGACDFCVLWRQMGRHVGDRIVPHLRVKSPHRLIEEVRMLVRHHGRRYLGWVDPCFNAHPTVPGQLAELLLRENLPIGQSAWMRADALLRDAASGALEACVRAGLNEVYLGIERADDAGLRSLGKTGAIEDTRRALELLHSRHPQVLVVGSFIYGLPGDTPETMRALYRLSVELALDLAFFIPFTPLPGTGGWRSELWDPTGEQFRHFNFLPPAPLNGQTRELDRALTRLALFYWPAGRVCNYARQLASRHRRLCRANWHLLGRAARFHTRNLLGEILGRAELTSGLVFPKWYEA